MGKGLFGAGGGSTGLCLGHSPGGSSSVAQLFATWRGNERALCGSEADRAGGQRFRVVLGAEQTPPVLPRPKGKRCSLSTTDATASSHRLPSWKERSIPVEVFIAKGLFDQKGTDFEQRLRMFLPCWCRFIL